jgi:hypothetical protein
MKLLNFKTDLDKIYLEIYKEFNKGVKNGINRYKKNLGNK